MLVWIFWVEPCRAQVAEVRVALETDHMVATMRLLGWSSARWARSRVQLEVLHRSLVLFSKLTSLGHRDAKGEFAVPALVASAAECKGAVLADT